MLVLQGNPGLPKLMMPAKLQPLLKQWNNTTSDYPTNQCIHQLFESQVERTPDSIAVIFEDSSLTYRELNNQANQLAHYLQTLQVKSEVLVGICIKPSLSMVVGLLGILKAGAAYVPLEPTYPQERLAFMLEDAQLPVLLSNSNQAVLPPHNAQVVLLDTDWEIIALFTKENPKSQVTPDNIAYTIYTSGSTGQPKGVQILHSAVVNFLTSMSRSPGISDRDILLAVTTISFDIAALELYLPLTVGASIVLVSRETASDAAQLQKVITKSGATIMQATPATWRMLLAAGWQGSSQLKILCGGEAMSRALANQLLSRSASVWNMYGPTETTIWSAVHQVEPGNNPIPIGRAIAVPANWKEGQSFPMLLKLPGVQQEVALTGILTWRQKVLAGIKFETTPALLALVNQSIKQIIQTEGFEVSDLRRVESRVPLESPVRVEFESGQTLELTTRNFGRGGVCLVAKTPDIWQKGQRLLLRLQLPAVQDELWHRGTVVWHSLEYAGVEFDETTPQQQEQIHRNLEYMIASQGLSLTHLRSLLQEKLPDYMMPSAFVMLDSLPLTPNLKVDRQALPAPHQTPPVSDAYVAPRNSVEEQLSQIWSEVLGVKQVGVHDNFFEPGGHSLMTAQLLSQVRDKFQVLPLQTLFEAPTVAKLAQAIRCASLSLPEAKRCVIGVTEDCPESSNLNTRPPARIEIRPPSPPTLGGTGVQSPPELGDLGGFQDSCRRSTELIASLQADAVLENAITPDAAQDLSEEPKRILLTGATGFVGAFLLHELLQTQATIYCLVRASTVEQAKEKLQKNLQHYLLSDQALDERVVLVLGDLAQPRLGLSEPQFQQLATDIDWIYHNGAFVNLIYPYSALRAANVLGTKEIIKLASLVKVKPIHFISTLDVFQTPYYAGMEVILEDDDLSHLEGLADGYAQSKWVAEKLVMAAIARGIPASIYRLGTVTGHSQTGAAQTNDLMGRLIKGLIQMGSAPNLDLKMSLTPVDYVSRSIVYLSRQSTSLGKVFHLVSPHAVSLSKLVKEIHRFGYAIEQTNYEQWQTQLLKLATQKENALSPLVFLFTEWETDAVSYLETAALVSQSFDCQNTLAGLTGTDIFCPIVDAKVLQAYLSFFNYEKQLAIAQR